MRMMKQIAAGLLLIAVIIFAVTNMHTVVVELDPFGFGWAEGWRTATADGAAAIQIPLAFVIFGVLAIGLVLGVVLMRLVAWPIYRDHRRQRRELDGLRAEIAKLQTTLKNTDHPASVAALPAPRS